MTSAPRWRGETGAPGAGDTLRRPVIYSALIHAAVIGLILFAGTAAKQVHTNPGYVQIDAWEPPAPESVPVRPVPEAAAAPESRFVPLHVADAPPPSASNPSAASGENVPVKFGVSRETLSAETSPDSAAAPAGNTLAVPPGTGRDVAATDALPYSGGGSPTANPPHFAPLSSVTALPKFLEFDPPAYPAGAWRLGREAVVKLEVDIESDGTVAAVRPLKGDTTDPLFIDAAVESVRRARFEPARRGPAPVAVRATLPVRFQLRQ